MIVVAGEALVDLVAGEDGLFRAVPGGSPANVAVGLARLGTPTEFLARHGTGYFGRLIREHLGANGVGLAYAVVTAAPASLAVVSLDDVGQATYDFYVDGTADWGWTDEELPTPLPADTVALCTGSLALAIGPGSAALTALMRREHRRGAVAVVLDPNLRPGLETARDARARLEGQIRSADVVKASEDDLTFVADGESVERVAQDWLARGPALVVVTRGANGALALTGGGARVDVPARRVDVVDTVGAGDAFTAGLIVTLGERGLLGDGARERLCRCDEGVLRAVIERAVAAAAITCGRRGADPPTAVELAASGSAGDDGDDEHDR
ncbi:MAG: carbohydrate kinase family protein [Jiangellaceae bacterium]